MRQSVTAALIKITLLSASASCALAGGDMSDWGTQRGLVPPTPVPAAAPLAAIPPVLGLKPPRDGAAAFSQSDLDIRPAVARTGYLQRQPEPGFYNGVRTVPRAGLQSTESFSGIFLPLSEDWLSSIEASAMQESLTGLRRHSLLGQVHTSLTASWGLSLGLKYSVTGTGGMPLFVPNSEPAGGFANGYLLTPQPLGPAAATSYQLQLSYLYSEHNVFRFAYASGRDDYLGSPLKRSLHDARQFMLIGQHWLTPSWALSYDVYAPPSGYFLRSQGLRLGLHYRF